MKKIILLSTILLLSACSNNWNSQVSWGAIHWWIENYKIEVYNCADKSLKWCSPVDKEKIWIFKVSANLCQLANITDKDEINKNEILTNDWKIIWFNVDKKTKIINISAYKKNVNSLNNDGDSKIIDILFDLTYYSPDNKELENEIISTREKKLKEYLEEKLENQDKVVLRYIWTIDYGAYPQHKNAVLKDIDEFQLSNNIQKIDTKYYNLTLRCKAFKRTKKLKIYTYLTNKTKEQLSNKTNANSYKNKEDLISALLNKINEKYNSGKYSYGTYFLETLSNYEDFLNSENHQQNNKYVIISDFRFQLHPIMKKRRNIPDDVNFAFPPENISLWKKWTTYYKFYTQIVPTYFKKRCQHNENLDLIWLETDDIEIKRVMKDYYKNFLFKNCNVEFK